MTTTAWLCVLAIAIWGVLEYFRKSDAPPQPKKEIEIEPQADEPEPQPPAINEIEEWEVVQKNKLIQRGLDQHGAQSLASNLNAHAMDESYKIFQTERRYVEPPSYKARPCDPNKN